MVTIGGKYNRGDMTITWWPSVVSTTLGDMTIIWWPSVVRITQEHKGKKQKVIGQLTTDNSVIIVTWSVWDQQMVFICWQHHIRSPTHQQDRNTGRCDMFSNTISKCPAKFGPQNKSRDLQAALFHAKHTGAASIVSLNAECYSRHIFYCLIPSKGLETM